MFVWYFNGIENHLWIGSLTHEGKRLIIPGMLLMDSRQRGSEVRGFDVA